MFKVLARKALDRYFPGLVLKRLGSHDARQPLLVRYMTEPEKFWYGVESRHADKVRDCVQRIAEQGYQHVEAIADQLMALTTQSKNIYRNPLFVMGAGGSGTTWLGAMLGDLPGYNYGREIYIPRAVRALYRRSRGPDIADAIWAMMILNTWGFSDKPANYSGSFVNSGRSIYEYAIYREIFPDAYFVYIVRDPREQLASVTFRKATFRQVAAPGKSDIAYLKFNAKKLRDIHRAYKAVDDKLISVRYEDLVANTQAELRGICAHFGIACSAEHLRKIAFSHSAENMRAGLVAAKGNLDEGGVASSWDEVFSKEERSIIYPYIADILFDFGYLSGSEEQ